MHAQLLFCYRVSPRHTMSSSAAEKEQALLKKRLEAQLKLPHNQTCADCPSRRASWRRCRAARGRA